MIEQLTSFSPGTYVEIGFGVDPSALNGSREFTDDRVYIGFDAAIGNYLDLEGRNYADLVKQQLADLVLRAETERPHQSITFNLSEDGRSLPLKNDSVKEVYMANVLTSPMGGDGERQRLLREAKRVLQPGGSLVVKVSWDAWLYNPGNISDQVNRSGLAVREVVRDEDEKFMELESLYGTSKDIERPVGFFVIAEKP